jgi:hypothetical protein
MDEFSRPATLEDLKPLLRSLNEHAVDYLLIGGYALAAHGYQRAIAASTARCGNDPKD